MATSTQISVGQSEMALFYRLVLPDGSRLVFGAVPLDADTALRVIGNVTVEYSLIIPIFPRGTTWPFLRGFRPQPEYVEFHLLVAGTVADLYSYLMPLISALAPADAIAEAADAWWAGQG